MRYIITIALALLLASGQAFGQANNYPTPSGAIVPGTVPLCISSAGKAVKCDASSPLGVSIVSGGGSGGTASTFSAAFPSVGTAIGLYDGTNMVPWIAGIALGDGVNGNNTGAVAPFMWNGTTWDRVTGTAAGGLKVQSTTLATAANQTTANSSLSSIDTKVGSPIPTQAVTVPIGGVSNDACQYAAKTNAPIFTSATAAQLVAPSGSTQVYVCSVSLIAATAATVNFTGGTGATCLTGTPVAIMGSLVAANGGLGLAANGGLTLGGGMGTIMRTTTGGHGVCVTQSGSAVLAGNITYVQQ